MNIVQKFIAAWVRPWATLLGVKEEGTGASIAPSVIFVVVMSVVSGVISTIAGLINPALAGGSGKSGAFLSLLLVPLLLIIGSFILAAFVWLLVDGLLSGTSTQYKTSYRLAAVISVFYPVAMLLNLIPKVGQYLALAVNIWGNIVLIQGIIVVRATPKVRTWITCVLLFLFLFLVGLAARVSMSRQLAAGNDFGGDLSGDNFSTSDLDKELENLANQAKNDAPANTGTGTTTPKK